MAYFYAFSAHQLDVELSNHLHLQVDDVSVTGISEYVNIRVTTFKGSRIKKPVQIQNQAQKETDLKSSRVSWIMFWMKWICSEVRGAAPPCPTTSAMF